MVEGTGLENRRAATYRGFESLPFRQEVDDSDESSFFLCYTGFMDNQVQESFDLSQPYSWQAPEGVHVKREKSWYILFAIVVLALMALSIFVFKSITFTILIPVMATAVILLSAKPPRMINYAISAKGVYVADRLYDFSEFRAFGVMVDEQLSSVLLLPVKRFSPGLTIYFTAADGEKVVDMLGARLPMQEIKPDALDKFIRMIRL